MLMFKKGYEELHELLYESKERACLAIDYKSECPELSETYIQIAESGINQAEKLYKALQMLEQKHKDILTTEELECLDFDRKAYLHKYEKVKFKLSMYSKA